MAARCAQTESVRGHSGTRSDGAVEIVQVCGANSLKANGSPSHQHEHWYVQSVGLQTVGLRDAC